MAWARLDDRMPWSRKIQPLSDRAFRLYVTGIAFCAAELTDGFISDANLALLPLKRGRNDAARELEDCKLWTRTDGGWMVHDFLEYNRSAAQVKQERKNVAARQQRFRDRRNGVTNGVADAVTDDQEQPNEAPRNGVSNASPSRPVPSRPTSSNEEASSLRSDGVADRPEVEQLCTELADLIEANGSRRPAITKKWQDAARLMIDKDGRTYDSIMGAIHWSQNDPFWRSNILSMPKLREKYDTMRLQAERNNQPREATTDRKVREGMELAQRLRAQGR